MVDVVEPPVGLQVANKNVAIPLKSCSVKAALNGYVVGLNSILKYVNDDTSPLEVLFRFPIDQSYAVVGLEVVIDGRMIKAEIKEKEEARQEYNDAIASGFTAALAEEKAGDIFSISLGNLPPKAEAELNLKLVGELPLDSEGGIRFSLPTVLKPRYTPSGSTDPLIQVGGALQGQAPAVYNFDMVVKKEGVVSVTSPTHTLSEKSDSDNITVTLGGEDAKPLEKDLVILVHQSDPHFPKAVCELGDQTKSQSSYMGAPAVMLSFFPEFKTKRAACECIFLVDRSGSMRGSYIKSASETLILFLKSIPPGCSFNIIGFGSSYTSLFPSSIPYNQENLDQAISHAKSLQANLGGTELLSPLQHIFKQPLLPGLPRQVFVLTDGSVSNTYACINEVKRNVAHSRVFTFGIGSGASTALVNGLAKAGNGTAEFIKEGERMQPKVISSLKRALQPSVTDLEVDFQLTSGFEVFRAPAEIPTIFNGDKVVVYGICKSLAASDAPLQAGFTGTATLKGQVLDQPIMYSVPFDIPAPPLKGEEEIESLTGFQMPIIHHLAAKALLVDWSNGQGWGSTALTDECKEETVKLSIDSMVISEHTAFVAVDVDQSKPIKGAIQTWDLTAAMANQQGYTMGYGMGFQHVSLSSCGSSMPMPAMHMAKLGAAPPPAPSGGIPRSGGPPKHFKKSKRSGGAPPLPLERNYLCAAPRSAPSKAAPSKAQALSCDISMKRSLQSSTPPDDLTILISLQQAAGFWPLKDLCTKVLKEKKSSPPGVLEEVWGTVLALAYLERHCGAQRDEWELVALKAEMWLGGQSLPNGVSIASLTELAKNVV